MKKEGFSIFQEKMQYLLAQRVKKSPLLSSFPTTWWAFLRKTAFIESGFFPQIPTDMRLFHLQIPLAHIVAFQHRLLIIAVLLLIERVFLELVTNQPQISLTA